MEKLERKSLEYTNSHQKDKTITTSKSYLSKRLWTVIGSIVMLVLGLSIVLNLNDVYSTYIVNVIGVILAVVLLYFIITAIKQFSLFMRSVIIVGLGILGTLLAVLLPELTVFLFRLTTSVLGLVMTFLMVLNITQMIKAHQNVFYSVLLALFYFISSILIIIGPYSLEIFKVFVAGLLILTSISLLYESITNQLKNGSINDRYMISVPPIISFFLPIVIYNKLNRMVREQPNEILEMQKESVSDDPELTVYIQLRAGLLPGFGHVDLCFDGKVYSFGDYDSHSTHFGGMISDGVIALIPPEIHINYELKDARKMMVAYSMKLSPEQKAAVQKKIDKIMEESYEWKPEIKGKDGKIVELDPDHFVDTGKRIFLTNIAHFSKFDDSSPYRIYYGVGQNCSKFANDIIGATGVQLKSFSGIVTPGSLLAYLDKLYNMENNIVEERRLYSLNSDGSPLEYPDKVGKAFKLKSIDVEL